MGRLTKQPGRAQTACYDDSDLFVPLGARSSRTSVFAGVMDVCPICYDLGDVIVLTQCGHAFCEPCYLQCGSPLACMTCRQTTAPGGMERHMLPSALRAMQTAFEAENRTLAALVPHQLRVTHNADSAFQVRVGVATDAGGATYTLLEVPAAAHATATPITLLLDASGSMDTMWPTFCSHFRGVVRCLMGTHLAVAVFSDLPRTVVEPCVVTESNAESIVESVEAVRATGSTMLASALDHADALATRLAPFGTATVVCVTDGQASDEPQVGPALRRMKHEVLFRGIGESHNFDFCAENGATRYVHFPTVPALMDALGERVSARSLAVECAEGSSVFRDGRVETHAGGVFRCSLSDAPSLIGVKGAVRLESLVIAGAAPSVVAAPLLSLDVGRFVSQVHALKYITDLGFNIDDHDVTMHIGMLRRTRHYLRGKGPHTAALVDLIDARVPGLVERVRSGCERGCTINAVARAVSCTALKLNSQN
jgi:hypothetical protein